MTVVLLAVTSAKAQFELGGVVGGMYGVSAKYWFSENLALQGDLAVGLTRAAGAFYYKGEHTPGFDAGMYDFTLNPNVLYHIDLPYDLKFYTGGGMSLGLLSPLENTASKGIMGKFGLNAVAGLSYNLQQVPLVFAFDFRPGYGLGFQGEEGATLGMGKGAGAMHFSYFDWKLALAVRYCF